MRIAINQPTYLPWLGYFDLIDQVDIFVILDNVQFVKQTWQQRNRIRGGNGLQWLSVPVKVHGRFGQLIKDVEIRDPEFVKDHLRAMELAYRRAPFFERYYPELSRILSDGKSGLLADLNVALITWMQVQLQLATPLVRASHLDQSGKRTELLGNICNALKANTYLSPLGSAEYLLAEQELLTSQGVEILFQNFTHPEYKQVFKPFAAFASTVDLLFNQGPQALSILRSGRRSPLPVRQVAAMSHQPAAV